MTMKNLLIMQENEFSGTIYMYPSTVQPLCTHVNKLVTSYLLICFPAPYLSLYAKYSYMPNMPRGRTSPGLPYPQYCFDSEMRKLVHSPPPPPHTHTHTPFIKRPQTSFISVAYFLLAMLVRYPLPLHYLCTLSMYLCLSC